VPIYLTLLLIILVATAAGGLIKLIADAMPDGGSMWLQGLIGIIAAALIFAIISGAKAAGHEAVCADQPGPGCPGYTPPGLRPKIPEYIPPAHHFPGY
jgi:hypothetical protein